MPLMAQVSAVTAQARAEKLQELETVVIGGYATPQMWKISKDGHVLWLLVIGKPAPVGVQWRLEQLQVRVAESQLVLYASHAVGYSWSSGRHRAQDDARHLPGKDTLKDVLPPEIYARWQVLKIAYMGSGDAIEHRCPSCAMDELERRVMKKMPTPAPKGPELQPLVDKAARKYKVKIRTMPDVIRRVEFTPAEDDMGDMEGALDMGDVKCFTQRLDYLERMIKYRDRQANATTRDDSERPHRESCYSESDWPTRWIASGKLPDPAAAQSMHEKTSLASKLAGQQMDSEWMAAAQAALATNKSTFAVQRIAWAGYLSHVDGYIAKFRELGYEVKEPGSVDE
jgi:hypothetical protein